MNCYKCNSDKELSIKKHNPITFMCRGCRRAQYYRLKPVTANPREYKDLSEWRTLALESNQRIIQKYC